jgi:hypothetical protein
MTDRCRLATPSLAHERIVDCRAPRRVGAFDMSAGWTQEDAELAGALSVALRPWQW